MTRNSADTAKLAASASRAPPVPMAATRSPPSANPATCPAWTSIISRPIPGTNASSGSTCGSSAARAEFHTGLSSWTPISKAATAGSPSPGHAIAATASARTTSARTITARGGWRSASPDSSGPPTRSGRNVSAYVSAAQPGEFVRS